MKNVNIELPQKITVEDYHEFSYLAKQFSEITGKDIQVEEVCFSLRSQKYVGVVYAGKAPESFMAKIKSEEETETSN